MIKFFRHIRKSLLMENKTGKYFKYAIGEIFLVVIGILIALQINNWNENRKLRGAEIKLLQNVKTSIEADTLRINFYINFFSAVEKSNDRINLYIEKDLSYNDSLSFAMSTAIFWPKIDQEIFATITSSDLNTISNDSLKKEIIAYYSYANGEFDTSIERYTNYIEDGVRNIFNTRFTGFGAIPDEEKISMVPNDFEALKKDKEYLYYLKTQQNYLHWYMKRPLNGAKEKADNLLGSIADELTQFE
ncbi:DUF6090 family protein [Winogradskyella vincentii]|uniref:Uncharacterized protein n=1 Tax=Winogradskyella vincentii TaxID=2877122 RepID=A0ABS7Y2X0_9FLAO|nr:DUF6090 family protein [Winogradskyella vincentii]MCA0154276.1 hypothetical protein [Winogradskyella vincentii]